MSKKVIAEAIKSMTEVNRDLANETAGLVLKTIQTHLKKNGSFVIPGFGTFYVRKTKARKGVHPQTLAPLKIKAGKTVRFRASDALRKAV